jgi:hypothetical protein
MKVTHIASFPDDRVRWTRNPYYSPKFSRSDDTFAPEPVKLSSLLIGSNRRPRQGGVPPIPKRRHRRALSLALIGVLQRPHRGLWMLLLPADDGWPNTGCYGFSSGQTARPSTLLVYAHRCRRFARLAKGLKAYRPCFQRPAVKPRLQAFRFATGVVRKDRSHFRGSQE